MSTAAPAPAPAPKRVLPWLAILLAAVLAVAINIIAERAAPAARIDLTQRQLFTLAPGTREVLAGLREPITLRFYYSRRLGREVPQYGTYAERVRDMLNEYVAAANGRLVLEVFEPEPFSEAEDRALAYGLQGVPVDQSGEQVYFGLAASNLTDDERTIGFFQPERERFLEYDLTRLVYELSGTPKPVVGVLTALPLNGEMRNPMGGRPSPPWVSMTQLRQFFSVRDIEVDAKVIAPEIRTLWVVHPQALGEATLFAIDQFVLRGGRLLVFVDPHSEAQAARPGPRGQPVSDTSSSLDKLFAAWGVAFDKDRAVGDLRGAWRVRAGAQDRVQAVDYVAWFNIQGDGINRTDPTTGELNQVTVASAGFLAPREGATTRFEPLLSTSETEASEIAASALREEPNPSRLLANFRPSGQRYTIAARISGPVRSAFQGDLPAGVEAPAERLSEAREPVNIVVVADADVLEDRYWVRVQDFFGQQTATPFSDNGAFVVNVTDNLSGAAALIGLRSRGESARPFTAVDAIRRGAEREFREKEQALTKKLEDTEKILRELRTGTTPGGARTSEAVITPAQRAAIDDARRTIVETRRELRQVQFDLKRDIERLKARLQWWNVAAVPVGVMLFALALGFWRRSRRNVRAPA
jgi:ABC-type uncharacterized transport system involved in gliding motility auxiliary subunit